MEPVLVHQLSGDSKHRCVANQLWLLLLRRVGLRIFESQFSTSREKVYKGKATMNVQILGFHETSQTGLKLISC